jgi:precorrin-2 dehydrogenase/sirohydrochlorin ferrochelatase
VELQALADDGAISAQIKDFSQGDLSPLRPLLVIAATNDADVNRTIAEEARSIGALVNTVDDAEGGDFQNVATAVRGNITIAVSTGGASPALARSLASRLAESISEEDVRAAETRSRS